MGEKEKNEPCNFLTIKFPFLPLPTAAMHSPDHHPSPPRETLASVPFKWEEQPGKARPCTDIIPLPVPVPGPAKLLEPPPCRLHLLTESRITKMPSPTTVLAGPGHGIRPRFSSFRLFRESFDGSSGGDSPHSFVDVLLGDGAGRKRIGFLGRRFKSNAKSKEGDGGSFGLSSPWSAAGFEMEGKVKAVIYERLKHAVPWKATKRKSKTDGFSFCCKSL